MLHPFSIIDVEQGTPEWKQVRAGKLTSTCADAMLSAGRGGNESVGRRNLRVRLALERIVGKPLERDFQTQAMKDGSDREADAAGLYEALTGEIVQKTGFIQHGSLLAGCSLDGSCDDFRGIIEIKAPIPSTHLEYLRTGKVPTDYLRQVTHALWTTGAEWCDWLSYQPDFPEPLHVKLVRITRADVDLAAYDKAARAFLAEVEAEVQAIRTLADLHGTLVAAAQ